MATVEEITLLVVYGRFFVVYYNSSKHLKIRCQKSKDKNEVIGKWQSGPVHSTSYSVWTNHPTMSRTSHMCERHTDGSDLFEQLI